MNRSHTTMECTLGEREPRFFRRFSRISAVRNRPILILIFMSLLGCLAADSATSRPAQYFTDFHDVPVGKIPDDLMVMNGDFAVREDGGRKFLEVPGEPLDTFGVLFGPAEFVTGDVSAMVWARASGKRFPEFGVGSNDTGGIKLWVFARENRLELRHGDDVIASIPYDWGTRTWTHLRLRVSHTGGDHFQTEGKAWPNGAPEPQTWMIRCDVSDPLPAGRASIWAIPFSGAPIRFTDLRVKPS